MKDLDMSNVLDDARDMEQQFIDSLYFEFDRKSDEELGELLYKVGQLAREGNYYAILVTEVLNHLRLTRIVTTLCEGCLDRYGCDMCCPALDSYLDDFDRDAEEQSLGRPLFPNEY